MKHRAKIIVDIEYDDPYGGFSEENVKINHQEIVGDYHGINYAVNSLLLNADPKNL